MSNKETAPMEYCKSIAAVTIYSNGILKLGINTEKLLMMRHSNFFLNNGKNCNVQCNVFP